MIARPRGSRGREPWPAPATVTDAPPGTVIETAVTHHLGPGHTVWLTAYRMGEGVCSSRA